MSKQRRTGARGQQEAVWRERIGRQAASGQSIAEFCRAEGITASSFYMWRSRHRGQAVASLGVAAGSGVPANFIDVGNIRRLLGAATASARAPAGPMELRLELGGGMVLHLVRP